MALPVTIASTATPTDYNSWSNGHVGPFKSSGGNYYVILLDSTDESLLEAHKATDPTSSFSEVDGSNRPNLTNNVLSMDVFQVGDDLHIATQEASTGRVAYTVFHMGSDAWDGTIKNEQVVASVTGGTIRPFVNIVLRSDGDVIILYFGTLDTVTMNAFNRIKYARRESGSWTVNVAVDNGGSVAWTQGVAVLGSSDRVHFILNDNTNGDLYQRCLRSDNSLETFPSAFDSAAYATDTFNLGHGVSYVSGGNTKVRVPYGDSTQQASIAKFDSADSPTVSVDANVSATTIRDNSQVLLMTLAVQGTTLYLIWVEDSTSDLYRDSNADDAGWGTDVTAFVTGTFLFIGANTYERSSNNRLAFITDDATNGIMYDEVDLGAAGGGGGTTHNAAAALSGTGAVAFAARLNPAAAAAALTGSGAIAPAARLNPAAGAVALTGSGSIAAAARLNPAAGNVALSGTGTLAPAARATYAAAATLPGTGSVSPASGVTYAAAAAITGTGTLAAQGGVLVPAFAAIAGAGTLAAVAQRIALAEAALAGAGSVTPGARATYAASAALPGAGSVTPVPRVTLAGAAAISGTGVLAAAGGTAIFAASALSGAGAVAPAATRYAGGASTLNGAASLSAAAAATYAAAAALAGAGTMNAPPQLVLLGAASFTGSGSLAGTPRITLLAIAQLQGTGSITPLGSATWRALAALQGTGALTAQQQLIAAGVALLAGTGAITPRGGFNRQAAALLAGAAAFVAAPTYRRQAQALLAGLATIAAAAEVEENAGPAAVPKAFLFHVYTEPGPSFAEGEYICTWNDVSAPPRFTWKLNDGPGRMELILSRKVGALGEPGEPGSRGDMLLGNLVKIYVVDKETPFEGVMVYQGQIHEYRMNRARDELRVTLTPMHGDPAAKFVHNPVVFTQTDPTDIVEYFITHPSIFDALDWDPSNPLVGTPIDLTIEKMFMNQVLALVRQLAGDTWFWRINPDRTVTFDTFGVLPVADHVLLLGQHVSRDIEYTRTRVLRRRRVTVFGSANVGIGVASEGHNWTNEPLEAVYVNDRITDAATATRLANQILAFLDRDLIMTEVTVIDSNADPERGYDIELFKPGQVVEIRDPANTFAFEKVGTHTVGDGHIIGGTYNAQVQRPFILEELEYGYHSARLKLSQAPLAQIRNLLAEPDRIFLQETAS